MAETKKPAPGYHDKMLKLRESMPQGSTIDKRSKKDQESFSSPSESKQVYGGGRQMLPSEMGHTPIPPSIEPTKLPPQKTETIPTFQEWEKRQPGYGKPKRREPTLKERGIDVSAAPGEEPTWAESWAERKKAYNEALNKLREDNWSSDEVIGIGPDGKPQYRRRETGTIDQPPPTPVGIPPSGDGPINTAMDIYRGAAENYPQDAPIDEQQGFAVAASTQDYNSQGYAAEEPVAAAWVTYDGRKGEVREYESGDRFFVSFDDDVIIRMRDRDSKSK